MKKVKVLTFCTWTSVGSIIQALGLNRALTENGYQSTILLFSDSSSFTKTKIHSLKSFVSRIFQIIIHNKRKCAYKKRCDFINSNLKTEYYENYYDLEVEYPVDDVDCYIAGSDQIWHPDKCDKSFFLDFVRTKKRISYAASMGKTEIPESNINTFKALINNFDTLSVREEQCKAALQVLTDKQISVHIDPSFLLSAYEWRQYETKYPIQGPYILVYMIYWDKSCKAKIKKLKKRTGLPVYAVCSALSKVYADKYLFDVGVEEFIWLIDHAEYVITSSFHGAAMSTIFNKKFAAVINPTSPSRLENLLHVLNIPLVSIEDLDQTQDFDYHIINTRIDEERRKSIEYLKEAID